MGAKYHSDGDGCDTARMPEVSAPLPAGPASPFVQRSRAASAASDSSGDDSPAGAGRRVRASQAAGSRLARAPTPNLPPPELLRPTPPEPPPLRQVPRRQGSAAPDGDPLRRLTLVGIPQEERSFIVEYVMVKLLAQRNYLAVALFSNMAAETYLAGVDGSPQDFEKAVELVDRTTVRARRKYLDKMLSGVDRQTNCGCLPSFRKRRGYAQS